MAGRSGRRTASPAGTNRSPGVGDVVTVERRLRPLDADRLAKIRQAARTLASAGGYSAVTMRSVAEAVGVTHGTVYRYYPSKDHLLSDVTLEWAMQALPILRRVDLGQLSSAERVGAIFAGAIEYCVAEPKLFETAELCSMSKDFSINALKDWENLWYQYVQIALPDGDMDELHVPTVILGHVLTSCCKDIVTGRLAPADAIALLKEAAIRLVP